MFLKTLGEETQEITRIVVLHLDLKLWHYALQFFHNQRATPAYTCLDLIVALWISGAYFDQFIYIF